MTAPHVTLACSRCATPLVSLAPGAAVGRVSLQCSRCGHWLHLAEGAPPAAAGWPPARPGVGGPGWSPLPEGLASRGPAPDPRRLGTLEWIAAGAALLGGMVLVVLGFAMGRFSSLFGSLGGRLPAFTAFVLSARLPYLLALLVFGLAVAGVALRRRGLRLGRTLLVLAVAVMLVGAPLCLISFYLPIFSMADAVK